MEIDSDAKLFYRKIKDFGPGVGFKESMEKYNLEQMNRDNQEKMSLNNVAMNPNSNEFLKLFMQNRFA
tara:strand:- start:308 stop:511 length:204 start_codon:yes stop_codon:yes gene_type:complete